MRAVRRRSCAGLALLMLVASLAAPSVAFGGRSDSSTGYAGTVAGTNAFIGVAVGKSGVTAYVCDSRGLAEWFRGAAGATTVTSAHGYGLHLRIAYGKMTGTLTFPGAGGAVHSFSAVKVAAPAGLYRGTKTVAGRKYVGGWILLPGGRQRGAVTADGTAVASPVLNATAPVVHFDDKAPPKEPPKGPIVVIAIIAVLIS
jgi:hypothetical protein